VRSEANQRLLSFAEILSAPLANYRMGRMFAEAGVSLVENTPDEIRELALEMLDRIEGGVRAPGPDPLQAAFEGMLQPWHYAYGTSAHVAASFLRRHRDLMAPAP
jgi:putative glycosyltransferase (TIGR04372 family)